MTSGALHYRPGEIVLGSPVEIALARSAFYQAFAIGFRPPEPAAIAKLADPNESEGLRVAAALLDAAVFSPMVAALATVDTDLESLAVSHARLFGHTARGAVPAYETEYGADDLFQQPQQMADAAGFYAAFGLASDARAAERPDHVSCECEFLMVLARKEALALQHDAADTAALVDRATRLFLRDHLARFAPSFAAGLQRHAPAGFYAALGALLAAFVASECTRFEVTPGPVSLQLRSAAEDRVPMACGGCPLAPGAEERDDAD